MPLQVEHGESDQRRFVLKGGYSYAGSLKINYDGDRTGEVSIVDESQKPPKVVGLVLLRRRGQQHTFTIRLNVTSVFSGNYAQQTITRIDVKRI